MNFRIADEQDFDKLVELRLRYLKEDFGEISSENIRSIVNSLSDYFKKHNKRDFFAFLAEEEDTVISVAFLLIVEKPAGPHFITGKIGNVLNVYTVPEYRRMGIAEKLMNMLANFAKDKQLDFIELKATQDGYPLYKKIMFIEEKSSYTSMKLELSRQNSAEKIKN